MWAGRNRRAAGARGREPGEKHPITPMGYMRLMEKLRSLKKSLRDLLMKEVPEARSLPGKLHLNLQLQYLKQRQAFYENRIADLEAKLGSSEIVVGRRLISRRVAFGVQVDIENLSTGEIFTYRVVGPFEGDVKNGELSLASPLGRSLMGRYEEEVVAVFAPAGKRLFRILKIEV